MNRKIIFRNFKKNIVTFLFIFLVVAGKIVRYTIMKETLVDPGIGHSMITIINNQETTFGFNFSTSSNEAVNASDNAVHIFSLINFLGLNTYEEFEIFITIIWNFILILLLINIKDILTTSQTIFILSSIAVLNIFDFCLAKEPIQMLYFILMYIILISNIKSSKVKYMLCFFVFLLSAITFRIYYIIIAMFMVVVTIIFEKYILKLEKVTNKNIALILIGICLFYFVFLNISKYIATNEYNELIRVRLRTSTAASDMRSIFNSENLLIFSVDYMIMILRMLFPIELIKLGPKYLPYVLYQLIISFMVIKVTLNYKKISNIRRISLYIYYAFLLGSATFEPDFGSWIRHEAVLFPILLILMDAIKEKENKIEQVRKDV